LFFSEKSAALHDALPSCGSARDPRAAAHFISAAGAGSCAATVSFPALLLGSWLLLHKRIGLIQVTREGVRIFRNPHFLPRLQIWIPRAELTGQCEEKLATRDDEISFLLIVETRSLGNFGLVRIIGSESEDRQRFGHLANEIRRVLGGIG
jgi:hypothetical protein